MWGRVPGSRPGSLDGKRKGRGRYPRRVPVLRLFARARQEAGVGELTVDGATVAEVLADARSRLGPGFGEVLDHSAVWLNGEPAEGAAPVGDGDEVAVLPPVSGGA